MLVLLLQWLLGYGLRNRIRIRLICKSTGELFVAVRVGSLLLQTFRVQSLCFAFARRIIYRWHYKVWKVNH